jgi:predicted nuclease of predicted toxin-antitoxin system
LKFLVDECTGPSVARWLGKEATQWGYHLAAEGRRVLGMDAGDGAVSEGK